MRKYKHYLKLLLLILFSSILNISLLHTEVSEKSVFKVLALKGDVKISREGTGNWEKLNSRQEIFEKDKIKIERGAYLGLVHTSGRTVEIKDAGTYKATDIVKNVSKKETNLSKRLSQYVFDEISQAQDILSSDDYHKSMSITGSVERSIESSQPASSDLNIGSEGLPFNNIIITNFPKKTNLISTKINLSWEPINGVSNFIVTIRDRFDKEIASKKVSGNYLDFDLNDLVLIRDNYYILNISIEDNPIIKSEEFAFQLLSEAKTNEIKNEVAMLKQELNTESSLADRIILASYYEEKELFIEAKQEYEHTIPEAIDIQDYQNIYNAFLYKYKTGNY
jgi:hypothetical protein